MRNTIIATAMLAVLASASTIPAASAADVGLRIPREYAPLPPAAVVSDRWTGVYIGVNGGYAAAKIVEDPAFPADFLSTDDLRGTQPKGWTVGGTLGAQKQFGSFVLGVEADLNWADLSDSKTQKFDSYCYFCGSYETTTTNRLDMFGTARGRVGVDFNGWLPYVTGGAAFGRMTTTDIVKSTYPSYDLDTWSTKWSDYKSSSTATNYAVGWTAGAGLEVAIMAGLSAKAEYLFMHLNGPGTSYGSSSEWGHYSNGSSTGLDVHLVRAGVNYRF